MPLRNDLELALRHLQAGRSSEAERAFRAILRKHPAQPDALQCLGVAAFQKGHHKTAGQYLRKAAQARPEDAEIHYNLGVVLRTLGSHEEAAAAYRRTLGIKPDHAEAANNLGNVLKEMGDLEGALVAYRGALDSEPAHPLASFNLGVVLAILGRYRDALAAFRRALDIAPTLAEAYEGLGSCLMTLGQQGDEAVSAFRRAIAIRPDFAEANGRLGEALFKSGKMDEAEASLRRAIALKSDYAEAHNVLGQLLSGRGKKEEGLSFLEKAIGLAAGDIRYRHNYGVALSRIVAPWHFAMMNDAPRNAAFQLAIERAVRPGMHVLEIGTGSGLLAMIAARAGAGRVVTCERVGAIARRAREIIAGNGYGDRIVVLEKDSTDLVVGRDIDRRADLLVSEILSNSIVGEGVIASVDHARRELIEPDAPIIPRMGAIMACLVGARGLADLVSVGSVAGFDLRAFNAFLPNSFSLPPLPYDFEYLSDDQDCFTLDFASDIEPIRSRELEFIASGDGTCLGLIQWNRLVLDGETSFENHPRQQGPQGQSHWNIMLFPFAEPVQVQTGDRVHVGVKYASDNFYIGFRKLTRHGAARIA